MRRKLVGAKPKEGRVAKEPMAEGIVPLDERGRRSWASMSDEGLVAYAKSVAAKEGIQGRRELARANGSMYNALRKRNLLDEVGLGKRRRDWAALDDDDLLDRARKFILERGIDGRKRLGEADPGLYQALRKRKLLDEVGLRNANEIYRDWASMGNEKLVAFARRFIAQRGIEARAELEKADRGLYNILRKRKLIDEVGLDVKLRDLASMSDEELADHAMEVISDKGIRSRTGLWRADPTLCAALSKRSKRNPGIRDIIKFENDQRGWKSMTDDDIIEHTKRFIRDRKIKTRMELIRDDPGLLDVLRKRGLLDEVGLPPTCGKTRSWATKSDAEILDIARLLISEEGIVSRNGFRKADGVLYRVLCKRRLLDEVGLGKIQNDWAKMGDRELASHARRFMLKRRISDGKGLKMADPRLHAVLRRRGLLSQVGIKGNPRRWKGLGDDALIALGRDFIATHGIRNRAGLSHAERGLYYILWKRKLLYAVFFDIERSREEGSVRDVVKALGEFG